MFLRVPLLQGGLQEDEPCKVVLTCHPALDVIFLDVQINHSEPGRCIGSGKKTGGVIAWLSLCSRWRMRRWLCWVVADDEDAEGLYTVGVVLFVSS